MGLAENRSVAADGSYLMDQEGAMRFVWVALAGAVGATARYAIGLNVDESRFPWGTLAINVSGALLLGFFLTMALGRVPIAVMTPVAVGLLGGFTTFSTFAWEGFILGRTGRAWVAIVYISVSVAGGLSAAWLGYVGGRALR